LYDCAGGWVSDSGCSNAQMTNNVTMPIAIPAKRLMPGMMLAGGPSPCTNVMMNTTAA